MSLSDVPTRLMWPQRHFIGRRRRRGTARRESSIRGSSQWLFSTGFLHIRTESCSQALHGWVVVATRSWQFHFFCWLSSDISWTPQFQGYSDVSGLWHHSAVLIMKLDWWRRWTSTSWTCQTFKFRTMCHRRGRCRMVTRSSRKWHWGTTSTWGK